MLRSRHYHRDQRGQRRTSCAAATNTAYADGRFIDFTYDANNRVTQAKDNLGRTVGYTYDASGRLWKVTDPAGGVKEYTYDAAHRMTTLKDPKGIVFLTNEYDTSDRVVRQTLADGSLYQFAYVADGSGRITQTDVTDPLGRVRRVTFNTAGYALSDTRALGLPEQQTFSYERDANNLRRAVTDPLSRRRETQYDAFGNVTSATWLAGTPEAVTQTATYEPQYQQIASRTDALGHTTHFAHDARGNLIEVEDALGHRVQLAYNAVGQVTGITDPLGHTTNLAYDGGDLASVTDPLGRTLTQFTDAAGRVMSVSDPLGRIIRYDHDALDRRVRVTDPIGGETAFAYDANGRLLSLTDPRGGITAYTYDLRDRVATRTDPLGAVESTLYDGLDNPIQHTDRRGQIATFTYDALNRRTKAEYGRGQQGQTLTPPDATVDTTYDAGNRPTRIVDSQGGTIDRSYDGFDRLLQETTAQGQVGYTYDAAGRRSTMTVAGQPTVGYAYDDANRLPGIAKDAETVAFAYDNANRRTTLTLPNGIVATYGYDNANQLTGISYALGGTPIGDLAYAYDAAGQRTQIGGSLARMALPAPLAAATYDAANRLTNWAGTAMSYDANGNLTSDGAKTYTWDSRNRLVGLAGAATASFAYDAFGRRTVKTIGGAARGFLYDGLNPVQELAGTTPVANLLSGGIDELFSRTDAAGARSVITDALGSALALTDVAGAVQTQHSYEPYGQTTQTGAASSNAFQYTGRENDGTGLYFYRARYYDPARQRFVSEDPIGLAGGINTYAYVGGNPINGTDPYGLLTGSLGVRGSLFFGGVGGTYGVSAGASTTGQLCVQFQSCARAGAGASVGAAATASVGTGNFCEGNSLGVGIFGTAGLGPFGGFSTNTTSSSTSVGGTFGVGAGASGGVQMCVTRTVCF